MPRGVYLLGLVYCFLLYSRLPELIPRLTGVRANVVAVLAILCLLGVALRGGIGRVLSWRPGLLLLGVTVWMVPATALAVWKGGAVHVFISYLKSAPIVFLIVAASFTNLRQCRRLLQILAGAEFFVLGMAMVFGTGEESRFASSFGTLANGNDLSALLNVGLAFFVFILLDQPPALVRIVTMAGFLPVAMIVVKTASRSGLICLLLTLVMLFWRLSLPKKVILLLVVAIGIPFLYALLPAVARERYSVILFSDGDRALSGTQLSALESSRNRKAVLLKSLELTARHPMFGVGPGNFMSEAAREFSRDRAAAGRWQQAHNSYTQLSSEIGIPGAALFCFSLLGAMMGTWSLYRRTRHLPEWQQLANMAYCVFLALIVFAVGATFGNYAYSFNGPFLIGLACALILGGRAALQAAFPLPPVSYARGPV